MDRYAFVLLVVVKAGLLAWGLVGMVEYLLPSVNLGLQNDHFPPGTQLLHWLLLLLTGGTFLAGCLLRWRHTPYATIVLYATLATLCFVETVDFQAFGDGAGRYLAMSAEYLLYIALSVFLLKSAYVRAYFGGGR